MPPILFKKSVSASVPTVEGTRPPSSLFNCKTACPVVPEPAKKSSVIKSLEYFW